MASTMPVAFRGPGRLYVTVGGGTEYEAFCELLGAKLVATSDILEVVGGCGGISSVGPTRWALNISHVQDVAGTTTLTKMGIQYAGQIADCLFIPDNKAKSAISATSPGYTFKAIVVPGDLGALTTEIAQSNPVWPVQGQITAVTTPPALLMADEEALAS
jgi:hypothetical protein